MAEFVLDPADSRARLSFSASTRRCQRLRAARAEGGMAEAGGRSDRRQLETIALVIVPAAQIDRILRRARFPSCPSTSTKNARLSLRLRRQEFEMAEMGDVHDRFVVHGASSVSAHPRCRAFRAISGRLSYREFDARYNQRLYPRFADAALEKAAAFLTWATPSHQRTTPRCARSST